MENDFASSNGIVHVPVMGREVLEIAGQAIGTGKNIFVDCTIGEGGHSELLLDVYQDLRIIGFERDYEILKITKERLNRFGGRIEFINNNFSDIGKHLGGMRGEISGFLYDFGISSFHFEKSLRGFGFAKDEFLDMRLDRDGELNAHYLVNKYPENKLTEIFRVYGEERWAKRIAKEICSRRKIKAIETSGELAEIVMYAIPKRFHVRNIHPATRVFQAIRIEVNDELNAIKRSLEESYKYLDRGGIVIAISFHSLEDRIVKDRFRRLARGCTCALGPGDCICGEKPIVSLITKKPILPTSDEIKSNRRSRSAKLRACKKL